MPLDQRNFEILLRSACPIVVVETHDEARVKGLLKKVTFESDNYGSLYIWSAADGLKGGEALKPSQLQVEGLDYKAASKTIDTSDPETMLKGVKSDVKNALVLLPDFHDYFENPKILRIVKEIAQQYYTKNVTLIFVSHNFSVPAEIERMCRHFEISIPSVDKLLQLINSEVRIWKMKNKHKTLKADDKAISLLANNLIGLTVSDAKSLIRSAIYDDDAITHNDIQSVMEAKYKMVSKDGALTYEYDTADFSDVGGFEKLKSWLGVRKSFFLGENGINDIDIPKGMLLLGVQGCGKSLVAKAVAGLWGVPLLKLDFGALFNKYIGESEKNLRDALKSAELISPCVMWLDEIEKAIQGGSEDTGTSDRLLGTLLTWMAENKSRVFIVATSNDVSKLPPELMRKGRLDEIFFVDLPDMESRKTIFDLHLKKRKLNPDDFKLDDLASATNGFSGAEIEQAIVSARYIAHADKGQLATNHILSEINSTQPLSVVRAEDISQLRAWAKNRTVSVS